jgi:hypothetical protein
MTAISLRRARLLRLRCIETRVAASAVAGAVAAIDNLTRIETRLALLASDLHPDEGEMTGLALKTMSEMAIRLDDARISMIAPIQEAQKHGRTCKAHRIAARRKEEGIAKLHASAVQNEDRARELHADANRSQRTHATILGGNS